MCVFCRLLRQPLNAIEDRVFQRMHRKQPCFGNLPFCLLGERFSWLEHILPEVWEKEDNHEAIEVMHRLLSYYAEMAPERRAVDLKGRKAADARKKPTVPAAQPTKAPSATTTSKPPTPQQLHDSLCDHVNRSFSCMCKNPEWEHEVRPVDEGNFELTARCRVCDTCGTRPITLDALKQILEVKE
jgi:hypothetical protein